MNVDSIISREEAVAKNVADKRKAAENRKNKLRVIGIVVIARF